MAVDSEADDLLSPVEQLRSVFDLCDKDSDGLLTVSEFRTLTHQFLGAATQVSCTVKFKCLNPMMVDICYQNETRSLKCSDKEKGVELIEFEIANEIWQPS